ncbi:MAG: glycosyltransferase [Legionella sp.]|nr:glycosyltransferase [Legionella sp.]
MSQKLLIVVSGLIPTVKIIKNTLDQLYPPDLIEIILESDFHRLVLCWNKNNALFSGIYKILFIRVCDPILKPIIKSLIKARVKYLYYLDDNFWELGKYNDSPLAQFYSHPDTLETLNLFVRHADKVILSSKNLQDYLKTTISNTHVISAAFDFSLLQGLTPVPSIDKIKILYIGTIYRERDFEVVVPALKKILTEYPDKVIMYFKGFVPSELKSLQNIIYDEQFKDYEVCIKEQYIFNYDIGIAPLDNTTFNRAKTNLKYREYGACRIAGIYSDVPPYTDSVISGTNGLLVSHNTQDWYHGLKTLINNAELRATIVENAFNDVALNFTHQKIGPEWENILNGSQAFQLKKYLALKLNIEFRIRQKIVALARFQNMFAYYKKNGLLRTFKKSVKSLTLILQYKFIK